MSKEAMEYTDEQIDEFISQSDSSIVLMTKDLEEKDSQEIVSVKGSMEDIIYLISLFVRKFAEEADMESEEVLTPIAVSVFKGDALAKEK